MPVKSSARAAGPGVEVDRSHASPMYGCGGPIGLGRRPPAPAVRHRAAFGGPPFARLPAGVLSLPRGRDPGRLPASAQRSARGGGRGAVILLNPGPVNVSPRVTAALARGDLCHREPECAALLDRIRTRLVEAFAPTGGHTAVLVTGSGTAALEMAVTSVLSERGRLVVAANGVYGERMAAIAAAARLPHTVVAGPWTEPPDLARVEAALQAPDVEALAVVHHETTTGLRNPVPELAALARRHGKLLLVDSVSGLAGDPLDVGACDLVVGTAGKCIQAFPGIAFLLVRDAVLERLVAYPPRCSRRRSRVASLATPPRRPRCARALRASASSACSRPRGARTRSPRCACRRAEPTPTCTTASRRAASSSTRGRDGSPARRSGWPTWGRSRLPTWHASSTRSRRCSGDRDPPRRRPRQAAPRHLGRAAEVPDRGGRQEPSRPPARGSRGRRRARGRRGRRLRRRGGAGGHRRGARGDAASLGFQSPLP